LRIYLYHTLVLTTIYLAFSSFTISHAQAGMVSSGTGFFVSNRGHIITNEHVVKGCSEVMIRGAVERTIARVIDIDSENDLALLQTDAIPSRIAPINTTSVKLKVGDPVLVMGYPLDHGVSGEYSTVPSRIMGLRGPMGEDRWIEFASSAQQGNSGGPLMNEGGNVVGVIVGKSEISQINQATMQQQVIKKTDVAISLNVLENFLKQNNVFYRKEPMGYSYTNSRLENIARDYIVNIHCPAE